MQSPCYSFDYLSFLKRFESVGSGCFRLATKTQKKFFKAYQTFRNVIYTLFYI